MTRKEWLENKNKNDEATFIIARAVKDDGSAMYHTEYKMTPVRTVWEWLTSKDEYIVINSDHAPIDVTGNWGRWYESGRLKCAIITTKDELYKMYGSEQAEKMLQHYASTVRNI